MSMRLLDLFLIYSLVIFAERITRICALIGSSLQQIHSISISLAVCNPTNKRTNILVFIFRTLVVFPNSVSVMHILLL